MLGSAILVCLSGVMFTSSRFTGWCARRCPPGEKDAGAAGAGRSMRGLRVTSPGGDGGPDISMMSNPQLAGGKASNSAPVTEDDLDSIDGVPSAVQWQQIKREFGALRSSVKASSAARALSFLNNASTLSFSTLKCRRSSLSCRRSSSPPAASRGSLRTSCSRLAAQAVVRAPLPARASAPSSRRSALLSRLHERCPWAAGATELCRSHRPSFLLALCALPEPLCVSLCLRALAAACSVSHPLLPSFLQNRGQSVGSDDGSATPIGGPGRPSNAGGAPAVPEFELAGTDFSAKNPMAEP